ncbi:MAG: LysR family transcriptional regulator [Deltaproteobacteria bacterium]|nr:LysR family transcriptional regulator [Deltaproteobacteria bacterium]
MINFNQLRFFYEAAKCQNFSLAARNLCVTQPAVTAQIRSLEELVELPLFKRRGRRMALSEAGALLFQHAHEVFELEKKMERVLGEMRELKRGLLKVGTTRTYARYLMPDLIARFRASYPQIKIILEEGSSSEVCRSLLELRNELAVVAVEDEGAGMERLPFREEEVVLIAAPAHPLAKPAGIRFEELQGQLILLKEEGSSTCAVVRKRFEDRGIPANILVQTSNVEFIKDMVERGEGVSFLVRSAVEEDVEEGRIVIVPIVDETFTLPVHIAYLNEHALSPAARAFLQILRGEDACGSDA